MLTKVVEIPEANNPQYPLPSDYHDLTKDGKRQARVNASRQWLIPSEIPDVVARRRVVSTWFFDQYYLHPTEDFDCGFYDDTPLATPQIHWDMSRQWALHRMNVTKAPRGCAKSTHCRKDMLLCMITAPKYSFVYATSSNDNAKYTGQVVKDQCYTNSRINEDFAPEYDCVSLKPIRGDKSTGVEFFYLNNRSWLRVISAESRLRGWRPRRFRLDDPEYDEKGSTSMQQVRDYMERLLFKIAIPMVLRANTGIDWVGTFVSKRHFLWHALQTHTINNVTSATDPRFNYWARLSINAAYEKEDGSLQSVWEEMWPTSVESKIKAGRPTAVSIEEMPSIMGAAAFNAEMMGKPGDTGDQFFKWDPNPRGPHAWWLEDVDPEIFRSSPREASGNMCYVDPKTSTTVRTPVKDFLASCRLFNTVDTAFTESATSDRRVVTQLAQAPNNILFVLDMWSDRKSDAILEAKAFDMASRWRSSTIWVEVVKESFKLYRRMVSTLQTRLVEQMGGGYMPAVKALKIGTMSKIEKIETLDVRFENNLIKLPIFQRTNHRGIIRLIDQVESFNPDSPGGGLDKDDEIDTVAMSLFIIKNNMRQKGPEASVEEVDPMELLKKGILHVEGIPIIGGMDINSIPVEVLNNIMNSSSSNTSSKDYAI
jgi:hypothetical protein